MFSKLLSWRVGCLPFVPFSHPRKTTIFIRISIVNCWIIQWNSGKKNSLCNYLRNRKQTSHYSFRFQFPAIQYSLFVWIWGILINFHALFAFAIFSFPGIHSKHVNLRSFRTERKWKRNECCDVLKPNYKIWCFRRDLLLSGVENLNKGFPPTLAIWRRKNNIFIFYLMLAQVWKEIPHFMSFDFRQNVANVRAYQHIICAVSNIKKTTRVPKKYRHLY